MTSVVVVGGGASGVLAAAALAAELSVSAITVVERGGRVGPGVAYGTASAPHHLLNSPAGRMSTDDADDVSFVAWCARQGDPVAPADFVSRRRYGDHLASVLDALVASGRVRHVQGEAVGLEPAGCGARVRLADGAVLVADHVALALGSPPPPARSTALADVVVPDPWVPGALDAVTGGTVLLLGTGLTAVDVATELARRDVDLRITATSRHLLLPRTHLDVPAPPGPGLRPRDRSLGAVLAAFSERMRTARAEGRPWQTEVDGVRPQVDALWAMLDAPDRRRFVQRVSRHWEVRRHRMAPSVAAELSGLREDGRLELVAADRLGRYDAVVDCTGPRAAATHGWSRLVDGLLDAGLARPDALGIGLDVTDTGALRDARGRPSPVLHVLGPLRRGSQWETTAVPEIRQQASAFARARADEVRGRGRSAR